MAAYAELQVTSNFTFLRGGAHPEELVLRAHELGLNALALTDRNTLAGVVRAHVAAKEVGLRFIVGARLDLLPDGAQLPKKDHLRTDAFDHVDDLAQDRRTLGPVRSLLCLPKDRVAYGRLAAMLSSGQRRVDKGVCALFLDDVLAASEGQVLMALPPEQPDPDFERFLGRLKVGAAGDVYLAAHHLYRGDDTARLAHLAALAARHRTPLVATGDVLYHVRDRRPLQDVLTCIRTGCTIDEAGHRLAANAERHLKPANEMARLFRNHPDAIARTAEIAQACRFSLDELAYDYPIEAPSDQLSEQAWLEQLTWQGAARLYPDGVPDKVEGLLLHEFRLIEELNYAPYFLTVWDIVRYARSRGILCQGRGSAANSAVCYCLGITAVDPGKFDLLFERFVSAERNEPPDIDVDFEHERREEVIQYIYEKYGREHAGLTATVIHYRSRSAIREVGKAMGLSADVVSALASSVWGWSEGGVDAKNASERGLDPSEPRLALALDLAKQLIGFPRHLSQHVGGFVLTRSRLDHVVPISNAAMEGRTVIEWDKDDLDALRILKIDVLALGMLTCIRKAFELLAHHYGRRLELTSVPPEDPAVYAMLSRADSLGVFQVESRAQMTMLPRLRPSAFYDLIIEVAIVRPGPIQGDMVHPYLRRRNGEEAVDYPSEALKGVLQKTLGVPLFQEQAMQIAIIGAGFTPSEADRLRRAMATFKRVGTIDRFGRRFIEGMVTNGYPRDFAEKCFKQIEGFGTYGFPESHAASFAHLVYVSSWLKCHYPEVFACALLNSQPMGFYAPAQIVRDAREHGVVVLPVDINASDWDCTLEPMEVSAQPTPAGQPPPSSTGHGSHPGPKPSQRPIPELSFGEPARATSPASRRGGHVLPASLREDQGWTHASSVLRAEICSATAPCPSGPPAGTGLVGHGPSIPLGRCDNPAPPKPPSMTLGPEGAQTDPTLACSTSAISPGRIISLPPGQHDGPGELPSKVSKLKVFPRQSPKVAADPVPSATVRREAPGRSVSPGRLVLRPWPAGLSRSPLTGSTSLLCARRTDSHDRMDQRSRVCEAKVNQRWSTWPHRGPVLEGRASSCPHRPTATFFLVDLSAPEPSSRIGGCTAESSGWYPDGPLIVCRNCGTGWSARRPGSLLFSPPIKRAYAQGPASWPSLSYHQIIIRMSHQEMKAVRNDRIFQNALILNAHSLAGWSMRSWESVSDSPLSGRSDPHDRMDQRLHVCATDITTSLLAVADWEMAASTSNLGSIRCNRDEQVCSSTSPLLASTLPASSAQGNGSTADAGEIAVRGGDRAEPRRPSRGHTFQDRAPWPTTPYGQDTNETYSQSTIDRQPDRGVHESSTPEAHSLAGWSMRPWESELASPLLGWTESNDRMDQRLQVCTAGVKEGLRMGGAASVFARNRDEPARLGAQVLPASLLSEAQSRESNLAAEIEAIEPAAGWKNRAAAKAGAGSAMEVLGRPRERESGAAVEVGETGAIDPAAGREPGLVAEVQAVRSSRLALVREDGASAEVRAPIAGGAAEPMPSRGSRSVAEATGGSEARAASRSGGGSAGPRCLAGQDPGEPRFALRLGFRQVKGLKQEEMTRVVALRGRGYASIVDLRQRTGVRQQALDHLARADAFRSLKRDRRSGVWDAIGLDRSGHEVDLPPLFAWASARAAPSAVTDQNHPQVARSAVADDEVELPAMSEGQEVSEDYRSVRLTLRTHPLALVRPKLAQRVIPAAELARTENGRRVEVAGLVLVRQRPGTASGVIFITIEDESGVANLVVWPKVFERFRKVVLGAQLILVSGRVQKEGLVIHVIAERLTDRTDLLRDLADPEDQAPAARSGSGFEAPVARADRVKRGTSRRSRTTSIEAPLAHADGPKGGGDAPDPRDPLWRPRDLDHHRSHQQPAFGNTLARADEVKRPVNEVGNEKAAQDERLKEKVSGFKSRDFR